MKSRVDQFESHGVHNVIKNLQVLIESLQEIVHEKGSVAVEEYDRILQIYEMLRNKFNNVDPILFPQGMLDKIQNQLISVGNELDAFKKDKNIAHLRNANNHVDNVYMTRNRWSYFDAGESGESIREDIISFRRSAGQYIKYLEDENKKIEERFDALNNKFSEFAEGIENQKGRLDSAIGQFQQQFSESEDRRRKKGEEIYNEINDNLRDMLLKNESKISDVIEKANSKFGSFSKEMETGLSDLYDETDIKIGIQFSEIEAHKKKAEELVSVISNTGMVGGYQKNANIERRFKIGWQFLSLCSLIGLIIFAYFAFTETLGDKIEWATIGARAFVALTFGVMAAWGIRQADKHDLQERQNRKMELELSSIDPFLISLETNKRHQIKEELSRKFFGHNHLNMKFRKKDRNEGTAIDAVQLALETIKELVGKSP